MGLVGRRRFIATAGALLAGSLAHAQRAGRLVRVGFLVPYARSAAEPMIAALREGLFGLGYREGENLVIEFRSPEGKVDRLPALANELAALEPDVLVTGGTRAAFALKRATTTIPIVANSVGDAVETGLVASLAHPGGNLTGITFFIQDLYAKRLELLGEAVPQASRLAVLLDPTNAAIFTNIRKMEAAAALMKIDLVRFEARSADDFEGVFAAMGTQGVHALFVVQGPLFTAGNAAVAAFAVRHRLPSTGSEAYGRAGGMLGYGVHNEEMFRRTVFYVDKILKGAKPRDLPVERPTRFELVANLKTARALGVTLPRSILLRADKVIE